MHTQKAAEATSTDAMEAMMVGEVAASHDYGVEQGDNDLEYLGDNIGADYNDSNQDQFDYNTSPEPGYENNEVQMDRYHENEPEVYVESDFN